MEETYWQAFRCKLGELGDAVDIRDCQNKENFILEQNVKSFIVFHFYEELPCLLLLPVLWRFRVPLNIAWFRRALLLYVSCFVYAGPNVLQYFCSYLDDHHVACTPPPALFYFLFCPGNIFVKDSYPFCRIHLLFLFWILIFFCSGYCIRICQLANCWDSIISDH